MREVAPLRATIRSGPTHANVLERRLKLHPARRDLARLHTIAPHASLLAASPGVLARRGAITSMATRSASRWSLAFTTAIDDDDERGKTDSMTERSPGRSRATTAFLATAALLGFAANSLLCRMALGPRLLDAATFTSVRLVADALTLAILVKLTSREKVSIGGSWPAAVALFAYAATFSFAYLRLSTGTGALILFGIVQVTMIGWGVIRGERLRLSVWLGLMVALAGLVLLTLPGLSAPDPLGGALMALAGVSWGIYSLLGRGTTRPLSSTTWNFVRSVPLTVVLSLVTLVHAHASIEGLMLAAASGAVASGIGYSFWYAALRDLPGSKAAAAQLSVPLLAAVGGVVILNEELSLRLVVAGGLILAGVALAILVPRRSEAP